MLTYSEARQRVLFKASRDMRAIACGVLDDMVNDVECSSERTILWAVNTARKTAELAAELESRGHEECISPPLADTTNYKSRRTYDAAIDAFETRVQAAGGGEFLPHARDPEFGVR